MREAAQVTVRRAPLPAGASEDYTVHVLNNRSARHSRRRRWLAGWPIVKRSSSAATGRRDFASKAYRDARPHQATGGLR